MKFLKEFFTLLYQYQSAKYEMKCNFEKLKTELQKHLFDYKNRKP